MSAEVETAIRTAEATSRRFSEAEGAVVGMTGGALTARAAKECPSGLMPVAERFVSINGEGVRAGKLAAFVRFAGCNLSCSYCDTRWANEPDCSCEPMSVADIASWVRERATPCVTLTGGEPLLQPLLPELVAELLRDGQGVDAALPRASFVEIETNGAVGVEDVARLRDELGLRARGRLGLTLDYKLPSSGMERAMLASNYEYLTCDDTVKFVAGSQRDLYRMRNVIVRFGLCERCAVYVSPVFGAIEPAVIVDFVKDNHLAGVTVQLQLHKIIWPHIEKGV